MDQSTGQMIQLISTTVIIVVAFYFLLIRPQSKQKKEEEQMRKNLEIGDEIVTIGGIVGRVIAVRDDDETIIVETGSDKTRMRFKKWAISSVDTPSKQPKKDENKKSDKDDKKDKKDKTKKNEE